MDNTVFHFYSASDALVAISRLGNIDFSYSPSSEAGRLYNAKITVNEDFEGDVDHDLFYNTPLQYIVDDGDKVTYRWERWVDPETDEGVSNPPLEI